MCKYPLKVIEMMPLQNRSRFHLEKYIFK